MRNALEKIQLALWRDSLSIKYMNLSEHNAKRIGDSYERIRLIVEDALKESEDQ